MSGMGPSKAWLYAPISLFVLLVAAYCVYWFVAEDMIEAEIDNWITEQRLEGVEVEFAHKDVRGFPYRFTLDISEPSYRDLGSGISWRGDALEIVMQPWNYRHAIARAPGRNEISAFGTDGVALIDQTSAISFRWNSFGVSSVGLSLNQVELIGEAGDISIEGLDVNYGPGPGYTRFSSGWEGISFSPELLTGQRFGFLGPEIQRGRLAFYINGIGQPKEDPIVARALQIGAFNVNWGPLKLGVKGDFDITPQGRIDGPLSVRLDGADALSAAIAEAGVGGPETGLIVQGIGEASKDGKFLTLPISNGELKFLGMSLGQVPPVFQPLREPTTLTQ